jgi:hypothetical protein
MTNFYYIFIHDLDLINTLEERGEFKHIDNYQYVLLSQTEFQGECKNHIISNKLPNNIERYKNYLQFTGWYSLVANNIINTDYVTLLEYDTKVNDDIINIINTEIKTTKLDCYGFACLPKTNSFLNNDIFSNNLISYLETLNINSNDIINRGNVNWIVTSNVVIKADVLSKLIKSDMFINLLNYLKNGKYSGHFLERFITVFLTLHNYNYGFIKECVTHYAVDSHNTQNRNHVYEIFKKQPLKNLI